MKMSGLLIVATFKIIGGKMREYMFVAVRKFLYDGKTYKKGEIILRKNRQFHKEFKNNAVYKGRYDGE